MPRKSPADPLSLHLDMSRREVSGDFAKIARLSIDTMDFKDTHNWKRPIQSEIASCALQLM